MRYYLQQALKIRKLLFVWLVPIVLLPLPLTIATNAGKSAYVLLIMALFWLTEALPLPVTSLIPMVMLPMMGILSTEQTCKCYVNGSLMIFLGSLISAAAVEHSGLHQRIALKILLLFGTSPKWLLLGFMINAAFLSMWISNLAATALMIPIVDAVLVQLRHRTRSIAATSGRLSIIPTLDAKESMQNHLMIINQHIQGRRSSCVPYQDPDVDANAYNKMRRCIYLGICYAANIGGTGTLTGTTPNLIFNGLNSENPVSFANWMFFNIPGMVICIIFAWIFIVFVYLRRATESKQSAGGNAAVTSIIRKKYLMLGSITFHEIVVLVLFTSLIFLWFFRDPDFLNGWVSVVSSSKKFVKDATPAIFIVILFFMIPSDPRNLATSPMLMDWKTTQEKVSWGVLLLLGGGFAMAKGADVSGLSDWLGDQLTHLQTLPPIALTITVCLIALILTELASNTATCTLLLPIIKKMAHSINISPVSVMLPVTLSCSYAFMLPAASGPNAVVFDAADMQTKDMILPGIVMKLICLATTIVMINTWGFVVLDFSVPSNSSIFIQTGDISH